MLTKEETVANNFETLLEKNNSNEIIEQLPKLLKSYKKNAQRMEKILKQSDSQQFKVLKLTESLEETNQKVNTLLNHAGQGFLYFDKDMKIGKEFSKEVSRIFDKDVSELNITELLYTEDEDDRLFFQATLQNILGENEMKQEIFISLLKDEFIINGNFIKVEYKVLDEFNFMMILTDITDNKKLDAKIKKEQQTLKMIVEIVSSTKQFLEIKQEYDEFIEKIEDYKSIDQLSPLRMQIHTYKGLFAQKDMLNVVEKLHNFETTIDQSIKKDILDDEIANITTEDMYGWIQDDILILQNILGDDFFDKSNYIEIRKDRLDNLYNQLHTLTISELKQQIDELKNYHIMLFMEPYTKLVEQLAIKLDKPLNPLVLNSDDIYIDTKVKAFLKSLVHIFRNSVDHGIETLEERYELEKEENGTITCDIKKTDDNINITIKDDGKGIDTTKIKDLAVQRGLYTTDEIDTLTEQEILLIIFQDTFTTNDTITDISGRGVGLASVLYELNQLNGNICIKNNQGEGIEFVFTIPTKMQPLNIEEDFLTKLANRTISYFAEELDVHLEKEFLVELVEQTSFDDITTLISLSKDMTGIVGMSVSNGLSLTLVEGFIFGEASKEELDELKEENIAETLNITLGNILSDLPIVIDGGKVEISAPYLMDKKVEITKKTDGNMLVCKLKYNDEEIILSYFI